MFKSVIRTLSFFSKEIREAVRQPSLIFTLVLGPFFILLVFGLGARPHRPPLSTVLVIPADAPLSRDAAVYEKKLQPAAKLYALTDDAPAAERAIRENAADVALIVPPNVWETVIRGEQAPLRILYSEIDPVQDNYFRYVANLQVAELNREIVATVAGAGQEPIDHLHRFASEGRADVDQLRSAVQRNDRDAARHLIGELKTEALPIETSLGVSSAMLLDTRANGSVADAQQRTERARQSIARLRGALDNLERNLDRAGAEHQGDLNTADQSMADLQREATGIQRIPPGVLAAPFAVKTENVAPVEPVFLNYYTPAVLALLLQHIAISFAALSLVRDRLLGIFELFRIAPISTPEIILGKYLSYAFLTLFVGVVLTVLLVVGLKVPLSGSLAELALTLALTTFASLGIGFAISLFSPSERQAVQVAMLVLITSVFFGGLLLPLTSLQPFVQAVSYVLPVTYAIENLKLIMLEGQPANLNHFTMLGALGGLFFLITVIKLRRELRSV